MGGSYRQCPECGKRALSIATRCPGCGCELPAPVAPPDSRALELRDLLTPQRIAAALTVVAVLAAATLGRTSQPREDHAALVTADFIPVVSKAASSTAAIAPPDTARVAAAPAESTGELLVARTWSNVRKLRSARAPLEFVLTPGDTVLADSLEGGWYRVALEGDVLGYARRSTLVTPGAR